MEPGRYLRLILILAYFHPGQTSPCISRDYGNDGTICVCNADHCDTLPSPERLDSSKYQVFTSTKSGLRFHRIVGDFENNSSFDISCHITINNLKTFQKIVGFGGAFTDAFGINLRSLSEKAQRNLMRSYFADDGLEYSLCRVPIGGTDFSTRGYSYDDSEKEDRTLSKFSLTNEDFEYKIPYIQEALRLTNNNLKLFASSWVSPTWMKSNNAYSGLGWIKPDMYNIWAQYYIKFLQDYKKANINFWGITTGNEPSLGLGSNIPSTLWLPEEMTKWIAEALGPAIRNSEFSHIKIMILDDQRIFLPWYVDWVFLNETAKQFVDIIAVHWYFDQIMPITVVDAVHNKYPDKPLMATEACMDEKLLGKVVDLGSWAAGERYARSIIEDMNHHFTSWVDWNMALNTNGGPTYINNNVDSPIIVNSTAGEFYKQPMYYALGHFSKFVPRDSLKIDVKGITKAISYIGFLRPDNSTVVVLQNRNFWAENITIVDAVRGKINLNLEGHSLTTVLYY